MVFLGMGNLVTSQSNDLGKWYAYSIDKNINQSLDLSVLLQFRESGVFNIQDKYLALTKISFHPEGKKYAFSIYQYTLQTHKSSDLDNVPSDFYFLGQEVAYFHSFSNVSISHKLRLEQVWKENASFYQQSRLFNSIKFPLINGSRTVFFTSYLETFWKLDAFSFYRNRMFAGIIVKPLNHFSFTLGLIKEKNISRNNDYLSLAVKQSL
jgi:hypothetical protein